MSADISGRIAQTETMALTWTCMMNWASMIHRPFLPLHSLGDFPIKAASRENISLLALASAVSDLAGTHSEWVSTKDIAELGKCVRDSIDR
jgi:hypothetical protein